MMVSSRVVGWTLGLALFASPLQADIRVLFRFDNAGVQVHHVVQVEETTDFSISSRAKSIAGMPEGPIVMSWFDENGELLASTEVADPRVAHSPNHTDAFVQSRHGLESGGWLANGPDGAESVVVTMPEKSALGLVSESWELSLSSN